MKILNNEYGIWNRKDSDKRIKEYWCSITQPYHHNLDHSAWQLGPILLWRKSKITQWLDKKEDKKRYKRELSWAKLSLTGAMVYWPSDGWIVMRIKVKNRFEVYSLSSVTFVYYRELNSSSFILVRWVGGWLD